MADVRELRLVVTATDFDEALTFFRDALGPPTQGIDEVEVGRRVAGAIRIAFQVSDATAATSELQDAGATVIAPRTCTPWDSLNSRLDGPAGLQLTLFEELH